MAKLTVEKLRKILSELPGDMLVEAFYEEHDDNNEVVLLKTYEFKDDKPDPRSLSFVTSGGLANYGIDYFTGCDDDLTDDGLIDKVIYLKGILE